jgi:uncharacterized protein YdcH (DUF465 family)
MPYFSTKGGNMLRWNHDIYHELPEYKEKINSLMAQDAHFQHLVDQFHDLTQQVYEIQRHKPHAEEPDISLLKKQRLQIKDSVYNKLISS